MEQRIKALQEQMMQRIGQIDTKEKLAAFWQDFLGKKGAVADLMKGLGAVAKEDRPAMGKVINEFKVMVENQYQERAERSSLPRYAGYFLPGKRTAAADADKRRADPRDGYGKTAD